MVAVRNRGGSKLERWKGEGVAVQGTLFVDDARCAEGQMPSTAWHSRSCSTIAPYSANFCRSTHSRGLCPTVYRPTLSMADDNLKRAEQASVGGVSDGHSLRGSSRQHLGRSHRPRACLSTAPFSSLLGVRPRWWTTSTVRQRIWQQRRSPSPAATAQRSTRSASPKWWPTSAGQRWRRRPCIVVCASWSASTRGAMWGWRHLRCAGLALLQVRWLGLLISAAALQTQPLADVKARPLNPRALMDIQG